MNAEAIASFKPGLLSGVRKLANNLGQSQSQPQNLNGRNPTTSAEEPEGDGKVKTKLMSMWNNMKYGKGQNHKHLLVTFPYFHFCVSNMTACILFLF